MASSSLPTPPIRNSEFISSAAGYLPYVCYALPRNAIVAVGFPMIMGSASGFMTAGVVKGDWYKSLKTPKYNPPRRAFGIVWPILYAFMGYASHLVVKSHDSVWSPAKKNLASTVLALYYTQLVGNFLWTTLFFGMKRTGLALIDILALTGAVYTLTIKAHALETEPISTTWLLAPYCAWLTYASYLNFSYWFQNFSPWAKKDIKGKGRAE